MISTVTTTTVTTIASTSLAAGLGLAAVLCLIAFLIARELLDAGMAGEAACDEETAAVIAGDGATVTMTVYPWIKPLSRALSVGIVPLLIVFGFIVLVRVMAVL